MGCRRGLDKVPTFEETVVSQAWPQASWGTCHLEDRGKLGDPAHLCMN